MNSGARSSLPASARAAGAGTAPWYSDCGDGTYVNPVLFADYSDPDAIRVGNDYWLTSSSFSHVPGLPILHSRDLVNWSLVNHALPRLVPEGHFLTPRHGGGVWAPALRFHRDRFWIYYADPDFGIYVVTADDPRGRWSEPVLLQPGKGLIDPCPFWDRDGAGYLVHGWARSRSGVANRLTLHRLTADNRGLADAGRVVVDGAALPGWHTIEGPKLHRRGDYYYIFAPAGGVRDGYQAVFRARSIEGPYEARVTLAQGATRVNGPHQGAWVDTPDGEDWFLHFQELPPYGRVVHLQPMRWREDDWPVMGDDSTHDGGGEPVLRHPKPRLPPAPIHAPAASDEFTTSELGLPWQWQANPGPGIHSLTAAPGHLRLSCVARPDGESLWQAPHLLLQKFPGPAFVATTRLSFLTAADGDQAGLIVFGFDYAWVGLRQDEKGRRLVLVRCADAHTGGREEEVSSVPFSSAAVNLRVVVASNADCTFGWSADGITYRELSGTFRARVSAWVGAKVGLFASGVGATSDGRAGHADFDWFRVTAA